jgi:hypothetical protein
VTSLAVVHHPSCTQDVTVLPRDLGAGPRLHLKIVTPNGEGSGVREVGAHHHPQRVGLESDLGRGVAADLAVDVELHGRIGLQPDVAGGQERRVGQRPAGAGDRLAHGGEGEAEPVGVAEPVHHQLPVIQTGVRAIARPAWWLPLAMLS